jgi:hypothetical protein
MCLKPQFQASGECKIKTVAYLNPNSDFRNLAFRTATNDGCVALGVLIKVLRVVMDLEDCDSLAAGGYDTDKLCGRRRLLVTQSSERSETGLPNNG